MTLSDFATLSTAISGVAVTVSLIYLIIQTRQNTRHTRALIHQGATARTISIMLANQNHDSSAAWIRGNGGTVTPDTISDVQFGLMCSTAISALSDLHSQYRDGLMTEEQMGAYRDQFSGLLAQPGMRKYWNGRREGIVKAAPDLCAFIDSLCVEEVPAFTIKL